MRITYLSESQIESIRKLISVSEYYLKSDDRIKEKEKLLRAGKALKNIFALCGDVFLSIKNPEEAGA